MKYSKKSFTIISALVVVLAIVFASPLATLARESSEGSKSQDGSQNLKSDDSDDGEDEDESDDDDGNINSPDIVGTATGTPISDVTTSSDDDDGEDESSEHSKGDDHKSTVATFVQTLNTIADGQKNKGIGDKVREVAQAQSQSVEKVAKAADKLENRGKFAKFFFGPSFASLDILKAELSETSTRLAGLKTLMTTITDTDVKAALTTEISALEKDEANLQALVDANATKSGVFGWLVKMLRK